MLEDLVNHEGKITTATRFKEDVAEVRAGRECRMAFVGYQDLCEADLIECFDNQIIYPSL
ncbi:MAG: hypothetical protein CFE27_09810 [Alphaproteobacteria bacterium PA1]|nr:MAG: hypothetical protein CFE27_09810 [Alphaproteobacteria bacterium PA1]